MPGTLTVICAGIGVCVRTLREFAGEARKAGCEHPSVLGDRGIYREFIHTHLRRLPIPEFL